MKSQIGLVLGVIVGGAGMAVIDRSGNSTIPPQPDVASLPQLAAKNTPGDSGSPPVDRWQIDRSENQLDHKKAVSLTNHEIYLRCLPKFEGYITPPLPNLGHALETEGGHFQTVRFRIDEGSLRSETWNISDDYEALFLPTNTLRQVVHGKKLIMEYKPDYTTARTETLDLTGLEEAATSAGCPTGPVKASAAESPAPPDGVETQKEEK